MISPTFMYFLAYTVFIVHAQHQHSGWTIKLTPSNDYEGQLETLVIFKDGNEEWIALPSSQYKSGYQAIFNVHISYNGQLQMVYLRTRGVCSSGVPSQILRLRALELQSNRANTTYTKFVNDLAIKDSCQSNKTLGTAIRDMDQLDPSYCVVEGKRVADGEQFNMGCVAKCTCMGGQYGCVDMCAPYAWGPQQKCHYVHVPGQCCDQVKCEEDEQINVCNQPTANIVQTDKGSQVPIRRYPWAVLICVDSKCSQVYGGVIVGSRHILTFSPDLSPFLSTVQVTIGQYIAGVSVNSSQSSPIQITNITSHPDFSSTTRNSSHLQLLQVNQSLQFDTQTQSANLPFTSDQCTKLSNQNCPVMTVGWDRTDEETTVRQWFLLPSQSKLNPTACTITSHPKSLPPGGTRLCLSGLVRQDCTGPIGGATVVSAEGVDFVTGLVDSDTPSQQCEHKGTASVLPMCKYVDWIGSVSGM